MNCYLGIDIGSISTKGVIIDENNNIIILYIYGLRVILLILLKN